MRQQVTIILNFGFHLAKNLKVPAIITVFDNANFKYTRNVYLSFDGLLEFLLINLNTQEIMSVLKYDDKLSVNKLCYLYILLVFFT